MVWTTITLTLLAILAFLFYASYSIRSGVYMKAHCRKKTNERVVALTFDDGPDPVQTPKVLEVLKRRGVKACFFCIGEKVAQYPEITNQILDEGHQIGNHSHRHRWDFPLHNKKKTFKELKTAETVMFETTDLFPLLFRPPFGVTTPCIARAARELSYKTIGWNIRSLDTRYYKNRKYKVLWRIKRRLKPGSVILLHDRLPGSDRLLEMVLDLLHDEQYEVVPVEQLFNLTDIYF